MATLPPGHEDYWGGALDPPPPKPDEPDGAVQESARFQALGVAAAIFEGLGWLAVIAVVAYGWMISFMGSLGASADCIEAIGRANKEWADRLTLILLIGISVRVPLAIWQGIHTRRREGRLLIGTGWSVVAFLAGFAVAALTLVAIVDHYGEWPTFGGC